MHAADFGPSLSMFKKAVKIEFSHKIMYVCTAAKNFFVMSCLSNKNKCITCFFKKIRMWTDDMIYIEAELTPTGIKQ